jgi:transcriptional regulator with XRE-family HTH domain
MIEFRKQVGAQIRKFRSIENLKQSDLAGRVQKTEKWLSTIENGKSDIYSLI